MCNSLLVVNSRSMLLDQHIMMEFIFWTSIQTPAPHATLTTSKKLAICVLQLFVLLPRFSRGRKNPFISFIFTLAGIYFCFMGCGF